jgi:EAL domain-containing protein (putative c-di-GMP-specific phosphodiesterase class I)
VLKLRIYDYEQKADALISFDKNYDVIIINEEAKKYFNVKDEFIEGLIFLNQIKDRLQMSNLHTYINLAFEDEVHMKLHSNEDKTVFLSSGWIDGEGKRKVSLTISDDKEKTLDDFIKTHKDERGAGMLYLDENTKELFYTKEFLELFGLEYKEDMTFFSFLHTILRKIKNRNQIINLITNKFYKYDEFLGVITLKSGEKIEFVYQRYEFGNEFKGILCNFYTLNKEILKINYDKTSELLEKEVLLSEMEFLVKNYEKNSGKKIALFSINLKSFKDINNLYGLKMGDYVLKKTAKRLKQIIRTRDIVGRYSADEFLILINELKKAIQNKDFTIYYQPQVSSEVGDICGIEALVRWIHKDKGLIPPDKFIAIAEELDLIKDIEAIVLEKSIEETEEIREKYGIKLAINLSNKQFIDKAFLNKIKAYKRDMSFLEIEITESTAVVDLEKSLEMINSYKALGISIAIDDFGVGYSSLCHLKSLPIDIIKIDKSFVDNIVNNKGDQTLVQAVLLIAETLNVDVIAEGVENELQLELLKDLGCVNFQGYYFDRPCKLDELNKNIIKHKYKNK